MHRRTRSPHIRPDLPARVVGVLTAVYSVAITVRPQVLAGPTGLAGIDGTVPIPVAELTRSTGVRDAALALALVGAPTGRPLVILIAARVVSDAADAVWFRRLVTSTTGDKAQAAKVGGVALGWAGLEAATGWWALRGGRGRGVLG